MKTIRIESRGIAPLIKEHAHIKKVTIFTPKTGAISSSQTTSFYTNETTLLTTKFVNIKTIDDRHLCINSDHIIFIEFGKLIELQNGFGYFLSDKEASEYEVIDKGNYGYTQPDIKLKNKE